MRQLKARKGRQTAKKQRGRKHAQPLLTRRRLAFGAAGLFCVLILGLTWSGWFGRQAERLHAAWLETSAEAGLAVEDVLVIGRQRTDKGKLLAQIGVRRGMPMLAIDPYETKARLEALPWVSRATVERRLPRLLLLEIEERQPMALWQHRGRKAVIDRQGEVIPGAEPRRFSGLPLVVGEEAPPHTAELLAILSREPALQAQVAAAVRVGKRRWNLRLTNGIDVRLPEADPAAAWAELARVERDHGLLKRDILAIDLRLSDRMILRMAPGAMPTADAQAPGKET